MQHPFVTFIVPTYNSQIYLEKCLKSVKKQIYPKNKYEIFVIDGGSKDATRTIAHKHGAKVIDNPKVDPESAKSIGIKHSKGEIVALLDSDNEIISKYWLAKMVKPLLDDPNLFGVESYYFPKKGESIYNTYCMVAHIADPFSRSIAGKLEQKQKSGYIELTIPKNSSYPLGANGFLWNKRVIKKVGQYSQKFEESNFSFFAKEAGFRKFARIPGVGIYHYHVNSLRDFINKRLKIGNKYLNRKDEKKRTWVEGIPKLRFVMSAVYCASIIGPFIEGVFNCIKERQKAWLLHPLMCFVSVVSYLVVFIKRRFLI